MHLILNLRLKHVRTQMLERGGHEYKLQHELHFNLLQWIAASELLVHGQ